MSIAAIVAATQVFAGDESSKKDAKAGFWCDSELKGDAKMDSVLRKKDSRDLAVTLGEERVVMISPPNQQWGQWQFPSIDRLSDGRLHVWFASGPDSAVSYGSEIHFVSDNGGKTWKRSNVALHGGLILPDGSRIEKGVVPSVKLSPKELPESIGSTKDYAVTFDFYPTEKLSPSLKNYKFWRLSKGAKEWTLEDGVVEGGNDSPRYMTEGVFPIAWMDNLRAAPDGSLFGVRYSWKKGNMLRTYQGTASPWFYYALFYQSKDAGRTWTVQGEIPYRGDQAADKLCANRAGFTEPGFEFMPDGSMVCALRTQDGLGIGPMYYSRSTDQGKTWSKPVVFHEYGVWPQFVRLENDVVALCVGRPGVGLLFCSDGKGFAWGNYTTIIDHGTGTCSYTGLLATGGDKFMIVYSRWSVKDKNGKDCKLIAVREVTVKRQGKNRN